MSGATVNLQSFQIFSKFCLFFSTAAFSSSSVDPPSQESTDCGLNVNGIFSDLVIVHFLDAGFQEGDLLVDMIRVFYLNSCPPRNHNTRVQGISAALLLI